MKLPVSASGCGFWSNEVTIARWLVFGKLDSEPIADHSICIWDKSSQLATTMSVIVDNLAANNDGSYQYPN